MADQLFYSQLHFVTLASFNCYVSGYLCISIVMNVWRTARTIICGLLVLGLIRIVVFLSVGDNTTRFHCDPDMLAYSRTELLDIRKQLGNDWRTYECLSTVPTHLHANSQGCTFKKKRGRRGGLRQRLTRC